MIERETGYNTHETPQPGECYCHLLPGPRMCRTCLDDLARALPEEVFGSACYCEADNACEAHRDRAQIQHGTITPARAERIGAELALGIYGSHTNEAKELRRKLA